jgi:hypothetical protein
MVNEPEQAQPAIQPAAESITQDTNPPTGVQPEGEHVVAGKIQKKLDDIGLGSITGHTLPHSEIVSPTATQVNQEIITDPKKFGAEDTERYKLMTEQTPTVAPVSAKKS